MSLNFFLLRLGFFPLRSPLKRKPHETPTWWRFSYQPCYLVPICETLFFRHQWKIGSSSGVKKIYAKQRLSTFRTAIESTERASDLHGKAPPSLEHNDDAQVPSCTSTTCFQYPTKTTVLQFPKPTLSHAVFVCLFVCYRVKGTIKNER